MPSRKLTEQDLQTELDRLAQEHGLVGGAVAVWDGESLSEAGTGLLNLGTGVEATTDSVFQIGSISKVYTATLAMQLVEEGRLDLDAPIVSAFPEFKVADPEATAAITMRQLLTHTSGIDGGDYHEDFGAGDDACALFVESLVTMGQVHPPGRYASYNNAGYVVAGRVIEVITGKTWHQALADNLLRHAGLSDSVSLPDEALLRRAAVGHQPGPDGEPVVAKQWRMPHAIAAAGSCLCTTAADLVRFGLIHVREGKAEDGTEILSAASVKAMQVEQPGGVGDLIVRGLGWELSERGGNRIVSHGGGTLGQSALLIVAPDLGVVIGAVSNSPSGGAVKAALVEFIFSRLGVAKDQGSMKAPRAVRADVDLAKFVGVYRRAGMDLDISLDGDHLVWKPTLTGSLADLASTPPTISLVPVDELKLAVVGPDGKPSVGAIEFLEPDDQGRPRYVWAGHIARRVDAA